MDFDRIRAEHSLPDVAANSGVKLIRDGAEFKACCPFHDDKTPSFTIFHGREGWKGHCFGCGWTGDVIDFARDRFGYETIGEAARYLTGEDPQRKPAPASRTAGTKPADPYDGFALCNPPETAPKFIAGERTPEILNPKRDYKLTRYTPEAAYPYTDRTGRVLFYVLRVVIGGKKLTPTIVWMQSQERQFRGWTHGAYRTPRPLYGLHRLTAKPDAQVLVVEGEKCAGAAQVAMDALGANVVAVAWCGGAKALDKTSWRALEGRSVILWPDNDDEGRAAMYGEALTGGVWRDGVACKAFAAGVKRLKIVAYDGADKPKGWDVADIGEPKAVAAFLRAHATEWSAETHLGFKAEAIRKTLPFEEPAPAPKSERNDPLPAPLLEDDNPLAGGINESNWRQHIVMTQEGYPKGSSVQNVMLILKYDQHFRGVFVWNAFANEVYLVRRPPWEPGSGPWEPRKIVDTDSVNCMGSLEYMGLSVKQSALEACIVSVAKGSSLNPVVDKLDAIKWDGVPRVQGGVWEGESITPWLAEYLGADDTPINRAFGMRWLVSAVARAMHPGVKVDTMLVLEGAQGIKKSTALRTLAESLVPGSFTDEVSEPNSKDAGLQIQGRWIIEIAELDALSKAENSQSKSWLSRQEDRFRRPYGRQVEAFPRSCVFAGTVNPTGGAGYLKDPTGARRYWPVFCRSADIDRIAADAEQIWAEAVHLWRQGEKHWLTDDEEKLAKAEQAKRLEDDPWSQLLAEKMRTTTRLTLLTAMEECGVHKERMSVVAQRRVAGIMEQAGWVRREDKGEVYYERQNGW